MGPQTRLGYICGLSARTAAVEHHSKTADIAARGAARPARALLLCRGGCAGRSNERNDTSDPELITRARPRFCSTATTPTRSRSTRRSMRATRSAKRRARRSSTSSTLLQASEHEAANDAADQFIRENPTHPRVDYACTCAASCISSARRISSSAGSTSTSTSARRRTCGSLSTRSRS